MATFGPDMCVCGQEKEQDSDEGASSGENESSDEDESSDVDEPSDDNNPHSRSAQLQSLGQSCAFIFRRVAQQSETSDHESVGSVE